jgi:hypothetical protein
MSNDLSRAAIVAMTQEEYLGFQRKVLVERTRRLLLCPGVGVLDSVNNGLDRKVLFVSRLAEILDKSAIHFTSETLEQ